MFRIVESLVFGLFADPQSHNHMHSLEEEPTDDKGITADHAHTNDAEPQLGTISGQQTINAARIYSLGGKDTEQKGAQSPRPRHGCRPHRGNRRT